MLDYITQCRQITLDYTITDSTFSFTFQEVWLVQCQSHSHSIVKGLSRVVWNPDSSRLFTVELKETEEMGWPLMVALLGEPLTPRMVADEREGRALAYPWREEGGGKGGGRGGGREGGREGGGEREGRNSVMS